LTRAADGPRLSELRQEPVLRSPPSRLPSLALAAAALLVAAPAAAAQDENAGRTLLKARDLLRTGASADRSEAIRLLIGIDSAPAISCLEEAIQRSAAEMDKRAKEVDALDDELWEAEDYMDWVRSKYPSSYAAAREKYQEVKGRWDALTEEMEAHLGICVEGWRSFAEFRSEEAVDRIVRGATSGTVPLTRQMYIQALGTRANAARVPVLLDLLRAGESRVRATAVRSLKVFPPRRDVLDAVAPLLNDRCWSVRIGAAEVVARMPVDVAVPLLVEALGRETGEPALQVESLLRSLTGLAMDADGKRWEAWLRDHGEALREGPWKFPDAEEEGEASDGATKTEAAFFEIPIESRNLLLVMDLSGSMTAEVKDVDARTADLLEKHGYNSSRLAIALVQAYRMIETVPKDTRLNLLTFSEKVTRFTSKGATATESGKKNAVKWLNGQKTGLRTNIWDALRQSFGDHMGSGGASRFEDLPDTVIFLTDGYPTAGRFRGDRALADLVGLWNASAGVVVHCVGVGTDYSDSLMESISSSTGGYFFDSKSKRLKGKRVRPTVPPEERCPNVRGLVALVREDLELGSTDTRLETIPRAVAACGWTGDAVPVLAAAVEDPEEEVRLSAVAAVASLGKAGVPALAKAASREDGRARPAAVRALGALGPDAAEAVPDLEKVAAGGDAALASEAKQALARIRAKK
jgi:HEAT repeat protein